jgi:CO/xanthine dehydrogenase Mo-binding subunit
MLTTDDINVVHAPGRHLSYGDLAEAALSLARLRIYPCGTQRRSIHPQADAAFATAAKVIEADYDAPYPVHGQPEPRSSMARLNPDGTLELWACDIGEAPAHSPHPLLDG